MTLNRQLASLAVLTLAIAAPPFAAAATPADGGTTERAGEAASGLHDFDFLIGRWNVQHRRLKERLAGNHDWVAFGGTLMMHTVLGGYGNVDDNVLDLPGDPYRALGVRTFDAKSGQWSIWWLDGRSPLGPLDAPVRGRFDHGVGTFVSEDTFNGRPIRVRYQWSKITPTTCHWEQAFSPDGGATWETNWVMDFTRAG